LRRGERERPPVVERDYEDVRSTRGGRGYERTEVDIRHVESDRPREYDRNYEEDIIIRRDERDRPRDFVDRDVSREEVMIRRGERERPREVERDFEREDILIRRGERDRPREIERDFEREDILIRRGERDRPREYERERDYVRSRPVTRSRSREREEIIIRKDERDGARGKGEESRDEIIIRIEKERSPSPTTTIAAPEPPIIRAPPIHQEVITHHRHIDHGTVNAPGFDLVVRN